MKHEFIYNMVLTTRANKDEFKFEEQSPLHNDTLVALMVRLRDGDNTKKSVGNRDLINDTAAKSASLELIHLRNTIVAEKVPLELIWNRSKRGEWFPVRIPHIDMNNSLIRIANRAAVVDDEDIEIICKYIKE